jgi:hypothetical protein
MIDTDLSFDGASRNSPVSDFFKHPAVLLVLGFLCTGLVGSAITDYWKSLEWQNQQSYLVKQHFLQKQYDVMEDLVKAVAESNTAAEDVLVLYTSDWQPEEIQERKKAWRASSATWRVKSKVLQQRLNVYFPDPELQKTFQSIINNRKKAGVTITNFNTSGYTAQDKPDLDEARVLLEHIKDELTLCGTIMARELASK